MVVPSGDLTSVVLKTLHKSGRTTFLACDVKEFLREYVGRKRRLVLESLSSEKLRRVYSRQRDRGWPGAAFRIEDVCKEYMDPEIRAKWDQQLRDAQEYAAQWAKDYTKKWEEGKMKQREAGLRNLEKARKSQQQSRQARKRHKAF